MSQKGRTRTLWSMRILRHAARPRPSHRDDLGDLLPALWHRSRIASAANVTERPAILARAPGSMCGMSRMGK